MLTEPQTENVEQCSPVLIIVTLTASSIEHPYPKVDSNLLKQLSGEGDVVHARHARLELDIARHALPLSICR